VTLDALGRRYGRPPSEWIDPGDWTDVQRLSVDLAAHNAGIRAENEAARKAQQRGR